MTLRPRTIAVAALLSLASGNALAWETRVLTLGDQNRFIEDSANVWIYPQKTLDHSDQFILDLNQYWDGDVSAFSQEDSAPLSVHQLSGDENRAVPAPEHNDGGAASQDSGLLGSVGGGLNWSITPDWSVGIWTTDYQDPTMLSFLNLASYMQRSFFGIEYLSDQGSVNPGNQSDSVLDEFIAGNATPISWGSAPEDAGRKLDLFSAWRLSKGLDLGVHLGWGSTSLFRHDNKGGADLFADFGDGIDNNGNNLDVQGEISTTNQHITIGTGITKAWSDETHLDLALNYDVRTFSMLVDENDFQFVDPMHSIDIQGRFRFRFSRNWWLVPALQIHYDKFATDIANNLGLGGAIDDEAAVNIPGTEQTLVDGSRLNLDVGIGSHMRVLNKIDVYAAFGFDFEQLSLFASSDQGANELTYDKTELPYVRVGAEAPLWDWFVFRAGFRKIVGWANQLETYTLNRWAGDNDVGEYNADNVERDRQYSLTPSTGFKSYYAYVGGTATAMGWDFTFQIDPQLLYGNPFTQDPWFNRVTISHKF